MGSAQDNTAGGGDANSDSDNGGGHPDHSRGNDGKDEGHRSEDHSGGDGDCAGGSDIISSSSGAKRREEEEEEESGAGEGRVEEGGGISAEHLSGLYSRISAMRERDIEVRYSWLGIICLALRQAVGFG